MWTYLQKITSNPRHYYVIILLFILFSIMRCIFINADAPQDLTISASIYTDEGFKTYASRNYVLYGDWKWTDNDEYNNWVGQSPMPSWLYVHVFKHLGVSFFSIRIPSIIYSILTMILLFIFLKRHFGNLTAIIGLILIGTNFFDAMHSRLGFYESHLNFYIMLSLFSFTECFIQNNKILFIPNNKLKIIYRFFFLLLGLIGFIVCFYTKRSFLVIIVSIIPALLLYFSSYKQKSNKFNTILFINIIGITVLVYMLFAYIHNLQGSLIKILSIEVFGKLLYSYLPLKAFDPIHLVIGKGLYLEFIFLHPFTFFLGIFYALFLFYRFISKSEQRILDIFLASWLLFGFILLTLMSYHPSRYYQILLIPLIILSSRALIEFKSLSSFSYNNIKRELRGLFSNRFAEYLSRGVWFFLIKLFWFIAVIYTGVIIIVHLIPFEFKNKILKIVYPAFESGNITPVIPILLTVLGIEIVLVAIIIWKRKSIHDFISYPKFQSVLFIAILSLQLFQYGKWLLFHENNLYTTSKQLEKELPQNSIIVGSWSSGLVIENNLKSLIFQAENEYNHGVVNKLINNEKIPVTRLVNGKKEIIYQNDFPLYLTLCQNVVFEKKIVKRYKKYLIPENFVKKVQFGYFDVEIYRINR